MWSAYLACVENKLGASGQAFCHNHQVFQRRTVVDNVLVVVSYNRFLQRVGVGTEMRTYMCIGRYIRRKWISGCWR